MKTRRLTQMTCLLTLAAASPFALAQGGKPADNIPQADVQQGQGAATETQTTPGQPAAAGNVAQMIQAGGSFSTLGKAITAAGLEQTLADEQANFTIFAPNDAAFDKLPAGALGRLMEQENRAQLRSLLLHHVVSGRLLAADLKEGNVKSLGGENLEIEVEGERVQVDKTSVTSPDMTASNGVVHAIERVLVPDSLKEFIEGKD
jgi:uncharacterized surface protein with fasciclin (FAS1) repeats